MATKLALKKKPEKKTFGFWKGLGFFLLLLVVGLFSLYQYLHFTEGFTIYVSNYNIQNEYGRFLIEMNEDFIDKMVMFEDVIRNKKDYTEYSEFEKEKLSDIIIAENSILSRLANTPPTDANLDYRDLHENITESYALYIQGQLMKMEYILQTANGMDQERYILGESVTNLIGNFIIEYGGLTNKVRETTYETKYSVLDGFEFNLGTAESVDIQRDEDGKIIVNEDDIYLFLPDDEETVVGDKTDKDNPDKDSSSVDTSDKNLSNDSSKNELSNDDINGFIDDFLDIQNK